MEKETEFFRHIDEFHRLFDPENPDFALSTHGKTVKIQNTKGEALLGVLAGKSVLIPLSAKSEHDPEVKLMVGTNLTALHSKVGESTPEAACHMLGLPYCGGKTERFISDGNIVGDTINAVHIYPKPKESFTTQEEFLDSLTKEFATIGLTVTIEESL